MVDKNATKKELIDMIDKHEATIEFLQPRANSFILLRLGLGVAGMILPIWLIIGGALFGGLAPTLSDFYHSAFRDVFVGNLVVIAAFLFVYPGSKKEPSDWVSEGVLAKITGLAALGVATIPNENGAEAAMQDIFGEACKYIHIFCAFVFFTSLIVFCLSKFTRDPDPEGNKFYRRCGMIILVCLVLIFPVGAVRSVPGCIVDVDGTKMVTKADCDWSRGAPWGVTRMTDFSEGLILNASSTDSLLVNKTAWRKKMLVWKTDYILRFNILFWLEAFGVWAFSFSWLAKAYEAKKTQGKLKQEMEIARFAALSP